MLPRNPLLASTQIIRIREREPVLWVVVSRKIRQDRRALEDREVIAVMIDNGWDSAIGGELREPGLFLDVLHNIDSLPDILLAICSFQFLKDN